MIADRHDQHPMIEVVAQLSTTNKSAAGSYVCGRRFFVRPLSHMLQSVIGGPEKRLDWIGFTFCCASKMADPQSSTCIY
jgi:hypothetical protein